MSQREHMSFWRTTLRYARSKSFVIGSFKVVNTFCLVHLIFEYIGRPSPMAGLSMLPTLASEGEIVIEDRLTYRFWPIQRGDIITLKSPLDPNRIVCKRVFGLPGDTICVDPTGSMALSTEHVVIPRGHLWICGDNASFSRDSREYGPIPMALVEGKLAYRVWPPKRFTKFSNPTTFLN